MANAEARPARKAPTSGPEGTTDDDEKHLVKRSGAYNMILHRDTDYRTRARDVLRATKIYDRDDQIRKGVRKQKEVKKEPAATRESLVDKKAKYYTFDYWNRKPKVRNFESGGLPYGNQAHHILVCELFYEERWDDDHLSIVKQTNYNINNPHNIIYLPLGDFAVTYHALPNHYRHKNYSKKQKKEHFNKIYNLVDKAWKEADKKKGCEKAVLTNIYEKLIDIEDQYWDLLISRKGPDMAQ